MEKIYFRLLLDGFQAATFFLLHCLTANASAWQCSAWASNVGLQFVVGALI